MYVCTYVRMYVRMDVRTLYVRKYVCTYVCMYCIISHDKMGIKSDVFVSALKLMDTINVKNSQ